MKTSKTDIRRSILRYQVVGFAVLALLGGGIGTWAATTNIAGAVIARGQLVVHDNVKKVQHPKGGIVGEILVRNGDQVDSGDVVVRLDDTVTRANLAIITKGLTELLARKSRLEAERDGADAVTLPNALLARSSHEQVSQMMAGENRLFDLRKAARFGQKEQLRQRIAQLQESIRGLQLQAEAKREEVALVERELKGARGLFKRNLYPITKMTNLEREATRIKGEEGNLISTIARAKAMISETELQIIQIDRDLASEVAKELREIDAQIGEFVERQVTARDELKRTEIRAPQAGTVHQSVVHTLGGVVNAGETIMLIVPKAETLTVEAKVAPQDIDQLALSQNAMLIFSAFNQRSMPEISGKVIRISADIVTDETSGTSYYTVRVAMSADEIARLGDVVLIPGMPVEAFIKTEDRKVLSYLVQPLSDQVKRAFREQ